MNNETTCWAVFDAQERGMSCSVYRDVDALLDSLKVCLPMGAFAWVEEIREEAASIREWCHAARVGDVFSYRNGYIVRCLTPWTTVNGPKEVEDAT